ncbi:MAG: L-histidine N(alpha)-methyltransferase [Pirellulaceae bacterium]
MDRDPGPPLLDLEPSVDTFRDDVLAGMARPQKRLPSKYFYDQRGSELFEQICELEEYYPTRTELDIMRAFGGEMAGVLGSDCVLVEYGSGAGVKTRILLDHLDAPAAYVPVDISRDHLQQTAVAISADYDSLAVHPVCADFTQPFELPDDVVPHHHRVVYFPGSTIGNLEPADVDDLLEQIAKLCRPDGGLLLGVDLKKDPAVLEAAYNDAQGVTAQFNLNLLRRINRELEADLSIDQFRHRAVYNHAAGRVEMHLVSRRRQRVEIGGEAFDLAEGETICTEYSHKYDLESFCQQAAQAGLVRRRTWTDQRGYFAVVYFEVRD